MKFIVMFLLVVLTACSSSPGNLTDLGKEVQILDSKPGSECSVVGKVVGENEQGSIDLARNHARNLGGKLKANSIFINQEVPNGQKYQVFATAYQCE
ncbi:MAG: DUF4156 domain-containing protein [Bacteriovoracaceae bacterium]|nr:DUF4156 domain-containing protein [Bacteriovoracaceae bacterium]